MGQKELECHKKTTREPEALQLCIIMKLDTQDKADGRLALFGLGSSNALIRW